MVNFSENKSMEKITINSVHRTVFYTLDLPISVGWILPESNDLLDIFHNTKIYNYYGKSKFSELVVL